MRRLRLGLRRGLHGVLFIGGRAGMVFEHGATHVEYPTHILVVIWLLRPPLSNIP